MPKQPEKTQRKSTKVRMKEGAENMLKKKEIPIPKTLSDCLLLHQMGYDTEINDGDTVTIKRKNRVLAKKYIGR